MVKQISWGGFSELVQAGLVDDTQVETEQNGQFEFSNKQLSPHEGLGTLAFMKTPDFRVLVADCAFDGDRVQEVRDGGLVRFHFNLDCSLHTSWQEIQIKDIVDHSAGIFMAPGDYVMTDRVPADQRQRFVTVACRPEWLRDFFGVHPSELVVRSQEQEAGEPFYHHSLQFRPGLRDTATAILARHTTSRLSGAFVAVNSQNLVLSALTDFFHFQQDHFQLKSRDLQAISKVQEILSADFRAPPSVESLSRICGINRTKLQYGFKKVHGVTIGQFVEFHRMKHACQLLTATDMEISQIAFEVGYHHPASFSTRFKAHFGSTPSEFRAASGQSDHKKISS